MVERRAGNPTYYPGDLRAALVDAAIELIREDGLAALSLRAVARRAGVSHAAPAHHVGDRAGLLAAVAVRGHEVLAVEMAEAARATGPGEAPGAVVAAGIRAYVRFAARRPELFGPMFRRELWAAHASEVDAALRAGLAALRDVVAGEQAKGWLPGVEPAAAAVAVWSLAHGYAALVEQGALEGDVDLDAVTRVLGATASG